MKYIQAILCICLLSLAAPKRAEAFDLFTILNLLASTEEGQSATSGLIESVEDAAAGEGSSGRTIRSNSDVLNDMNPLADRDSFFSFDTGPNRALYLDREIEIYKQQKGMEPDGIAAKANRYFKDLMKSAQKKMSSTAKSVDDPLNGLSPKEKKQLSELLKKIVTED